LLKVVLTFVFILHDRSKAKP